MSLKEKKSYDALFDNSELSHNLKNKSVKSAAVTITTQIFKFILQFGGTAVLARLLAPEDFGLIAMTIVITGFISMFKDVGLSMATIQKEHINHAQVSALFWINVAIGALLTLIVVSISPLIAAFYAEPRLTSVTIALSAVFFIGGFAIQPKAILKRKMAFKTLAIIEVVSQIAGVICAIYMATSGYGYWSLVGQQITIIMVDFFITSISISWRPSRPKRTEGVREMVRFGADIVAFNSVNYFSRQMDNLLIGWFWGASSLAFYSKAYTLLLMPVNQINAPLTAVSLPSLSRTQNDPVRYKSFFLKFLELIVSLSIPVILVFFLFSEQIILAWLGPAWTESASIFKLLVPAAMTGVLTNPLGSLMLSLGLSSRYRKIGLFSAVVIVIAFIIGLPYGVHGVAIAYSIASICLVLPVCWLSTKGTPVDVKDIIYTLFPTLCAAGTTTLVTYFVHLYLMGLTNQLISTLLGMVTYGLVYLIILLFAFKKLTFFSSIVKELLKKT